MKRGFSLIELMVAMAVFGIIAVAALGALLTVTASGKDIQATRQVFDNTGFVFQDIVRESRLAVNHWCGNGNPTISSGFVEPKDCPGGAEKIAFNRLADGEAGEVVQFRKDGNRIEKKIGSSDWQTVSDEGLDELELKFTSKDQLSNGQIPFITINLKAVVNKDADAEKEYNLQVSVHPRYPEYENPE